MTIMLTDDDWFSRAYTKYTSASSARSQYILQRRITDEIGLRYYITVDVYDIGNRLLYSPTVQFSQPNRPTVNIELILGNHSIDDIELEFHTIWNALGRPYYDYFHEFS